MSRTLRFEAVYPQPLERVWQAISDPSELSSWLMQTDFQPRVGHAFTLHTRPAPGFDGVVRGVVLEVVPPIRLVYTWNGGPVQNTRVTWTLEQVQQGTRLTLEHAGFSGPAGLLVSSVLGMGWRGLVAQTLRLHLEQDGPEEASGG